MLTLDGLLGSWLFGYLVKNWVADKFGHSSDLILVLLAPFTFIFLLTSQECRETDLRLSGKT